MLQEKLLVDLKKYFRLNIYEVKIWTALLSRGIASAGELADISGVPRSRCYDVLESLEKKGFIIMKIGKPIRYLAIKPDIILERVKKNIREDADHVIMQFDNIKETEEFKELELLHKTGIQHVDVSSISKSVVGRSAINRHIKEIFERAKSSIMVVSTQEHAERFVKLLKNLVPQFSRKGVKVRLYASASAKDLNKKLQSVSYVEYNANSSFLTIDGKEMAFLVSSADVAPDYEVSIWISSPFFVNAVDILFEESLK